MQQRRRQRHVLIYENHVDQSYRNQREKNRNTHSLTHSRTHFQLNAKGAEENDHNVFKLYLIPKRIYYYAKIAIRLDSFFSSFNFTDTVSVCKCFGVCAIRDTDCPPVYTKVCALTPILKSINEFRCRCRCRCCCRCCGHCVIGPFCCTTAIQYIVV